MAKWCWVGVSVDAGVLDIRPSSPPAPCRLLRSTRTAPRRVDDERSASEKARRRPHDIPARQTGHVCLDRRRPIVEHLFRHRRFAAGAASITLPRSHFELFMSSCGT